MPKTMKLTCILRTKISHIFKHGNRITWHSDFAEYIVSVFSEHFNCSEQLSIMWWLCYPKGLVEASGGMVAYQWMPASQWQRGRTSPKDVHVADRPVVHVVYSPHSPADKRAPPSGSFPPSARQNALTKGLWTVCVASRSFDRTDTFVPNRFLKWTT